MRPSSNRTRPSKEGVVVRGGGGAFVILTASQARLAAINATIPVQRLTRWTTRLYAWQTKQPFLCDPPSQLAQIRSPGPQAPAGVVSAFCVSHVLWLDAARCPVSVLPAEEKRTRDRPARLFSPTIY